MSAGGYEAAAISPLIFNFFYELLDNTENDISLKGQYRSIKTVINLFFDDFFFIN